MEDEIHENINAAIVEMERLRAESATMEEELSIGQELLDRAIKARDTAESKLATITAENARLLARCERYERALRHYADTNETWGRVPTEDVMGGELGSGGYVCIYQASAKGWTVAREALAREEGKS
jgi:hypothetical protein